MTIGLCCGLFGIVSRNLVLSIALGLFSLPAGCFLGIIFSVELADLTVSTPVHRKIVSVHQKRSNEFRLRESALAGRSIDLAICLRSSAASYSTRMMALKLTIFSGSR